MTVIVGVDGSVGARAALEFAMDEAAANAAAGHRCSGTTPLRDRRGVGLRSTIPRDLREGRQQCTPTTYRRHCHRTRGRGQPVDHRDGTGRTPRACAVRRGRRSRSARGRQERPWLGDRKPAGFCWAALRVARPILGHRRPAGPVTEMA